MKRLIRILTAVIVIFSLAAPALANLTFVPNTYGISARSIGMGNAMTAVGDDYSAAYFNPGALGDLKTSMVDVGFLYTSPNFKGGPKGNGDEVKFDTENKIVLLGFTMNLSKLFKGEHGLGLGFDLALDNGTKSFLYFSDERDDNGQFLKYGRTSVTMNLALGVEIIPQLHIGGGAFIMVKGTNGLQATSDLAGNTKDEEILVEAEPVMAPVLGIYAPIHPMVTIGASYRGKATAEFSSIDASAEATVSESPLTNLDLQMAFKDTYVPQQAALGVSVRPIPDLLIAVDTTWVNWGDYDDAVATGDSVKDDATFRTHDIYIPRLGVEYMFIENLFARFGYYWEDTPFSSPGGGNTVVLDNAKHVFSVGLSHDITYIPFMVYPVSIGLTYFNQYLQPRTVESTDGVEFESSGNMNSFITTLTLRY